MYDPTAYENIKVLFEGMVYDFDLEGKITVIVRNDYINLADLSRTFNLTFVNKEDSNKDFTMKMQISSTFQQLASEWYPLAAEPGAKLTIDLVVHKPLNEILEKRVAKQIKQEFEQSYKIKYFKKIFSDQQQSYQFTLERFGLLTEENMDNIKTLIQEVIHLGEDVLEML